VRRAKLGAPGTLAACRAAIKSRSTMVGFRTAAAGFDFFWFPRKKHGSRQTAIISRSASRAVRSKKERGDRRGIMALGRRHRAAFHQATPRTKVHWPPGLLPGTPDRSAHQGRYRPRKRGRGTPTFPHLLNDNFSLGHRSRNLPKPATARRMRRETPIRQLGAVALPEIGADCRRVELNETRAWFVWRAAADRAKGRRAHARGRPNWPSARPDQHLR